MAHLKGSLNATKFQITGTQGVYDVHFNPFRRWVVTLTQNGQTIQVPCFVTCHYAYMACSYFDYSGEWEFALEETVP